jgi:hypothetical protein
VLSVSVQPGERGGIQATAFFFIPMFIPIARERSVN